MLPASRVSFGQQVGGPVEREITAAASLIWLSCSDSPFSNIQRRIFSVTERWVTSGRACFVVRVRSFCQIEGDSKCLVIRAMGASLSISVTYNGVFCGTERLEQASGRRNCWKWCYFVLAVAFVSLGGSVRSAMLRQGRCQADTRKPVRGFLRDGRVCLTPMLAMVCD